MSLQSNIPDRSVRSEATIPSGDPAATPTRGTSRPTPSRGRPRRAEARHRGVRSPPPDSVGPASADPLATIDHVRSVVAEYDKASTFDLEPVLVELDALREATAAFVNGADDADGYPSELDRLVKTLTRLNFTTEGQFEQDPAEDGRRSHASKLSSRYRLSTATTSGSSNSNSNGRETASSADPTATEVAVANAVPPILLFSERWVW